MQNVQHINCFQSAYDTPHILEKLMLIIYSGILGEHGNKTCKLRTPNRIKLVSLAPNSLFYPSKEGV